MDLEVLIPLGFFAAAAWVIYVFVDGFGRRQQMRLAAEFHGKLVDRVGSTQELAELLNTPGGANLLDALAVQRDAGPHIRILRAVQSGLVLLTLGLGLFLLFRIEGFPGRAEEGFFVMATVSTSLGVGLLLSAGASYGLSRRMGLINGKVAGRPRPAQSA